MHLDPPIWTIYLGSFEDQLEINGFDPHCLDQRDVDQLRELFATDERTAWHVFQAVASAAEAFAHSRAMES
jgi:hypothetical protein